MSFISWNTSNYVEINIPIEKAKAMVLKNDEQALSELCELIQKYVTWQEDIKRINTKRIFEGAKVSNV
ncbi:MAG TPA: hypothetical protein VGE97_07845 [Nitrososphaera sp.]